MYPERNAGKLRLGALRTARSMKNEKDRCQLGVNGLLSLTFSDLEPKLKTQVMADATIEDAAKEEWDMIVLPGGLPGA